MSRPHAIKLALMFDIDNSKLVKCLRKVRTHLLQLFFQAFLSTIGLLHQGLRPCKFLRQTFVRVQALQLGTRELHAQVLDLVQPPSMLAPLALTRSRRGLCAPTSKLAASNTVLRRLWHWLVRASSILPSWLASTCFRAWAGGMAAAMRGRRTSWTVVRGGGSRRHGMRGHAHQRQLCFCWAVKCKGACAI